MPTLEFLQFLAREDNFCVLVHNPGTGQTLSIDAPDSDKIQTELDRRDWRLSSLLITHHHFDHVEGIESLCQRYGCDVIGPAAESGKISNLTTTVSEGDSIELLGESIQLFDAPGHTLGHIMYYMPASGVLFSGDTLFSLGCGKLFEGSPGQMWSSLQKIMALPPETVVYVGHDYTVENGEYALQWEPGNAHLRQRMHTARELQKLGKPTLPTTVKQELETNPFLRPHSVELRHTLNMPDATDLDVFTRLRELRG